MYVVEAGSSTEMIANSLLKSRTIPLEGLGKLFTDEANCERWLYMYIVKKDDVTTASININERMNWLWYRMEVNSYLQRY